MFVGITTNCCDYQHREGEESVLGKEYDDSTKQRFLTYYEVMIINKLLTAILLPLLLVAPVRADSSAELSKGISAISEKQWDTARMVLVPLAESGHREAQFRLGYLYRNGFGVEKDFTKAVSWYRKAAISGHAMAQHYYAINLEIGRGIKKDLKEAAIWYRKAAEQGYADAQHWMAMASLSGNGLARDLEASYLWHKLALQDDPECGRLQNGLDELDKLLARSQIQALDERLKRWRANGRQGMP